jgi:hypothetical protein
MTNFQLTLLSILEYLACNTANFTGAVNMHSWLSSSLFNTVSSVTSGRLYFDNLVAKAWRGMPSSLVAQTFNGVTDKKSSSILIYLNESEVIYTGMNSIN